MRNLTREEVAALPLPVKVRLRWRLRARPKQLTPKRHHLCTRPIHECDQLLAEAAERWPEPEDDDVRLAWLAEQGHRDWFIWLILAGRGWGKTRTGAEDVVKFALENPGCRIALVAATFADGRDTMVEGESGILSLLPEPLYESWNRSIGELVLKNGSRMKIFSAEEPERLRGPQHHRAWCDELAAWTYLKDTWDQLMFGLRLGDLPQVVITTTPKPLKFLRRMIARSREPLGGVVITMGSTFENVRNLARVAIQELREAYEGTRMGRQELYAEVLDEIEGALWTEAIIDRYRISFAQAPELEEYGRIVVGADPSVSGKDTSDDYGIVVVGKSIGACPVCPHTVSGGKPHAFVMADSTTHGSPEHCARKVVQTYRTYDADEVVAEVNNGGELVKTVIRTVDASVPVDEVHASRGKKIRAEPVSALYEQGRVHHIDRLPKLEEEMTEWSDDSKDPSPNRMDALVWAITKLMVPSRLVRTSDHYEDTRDEGRR